MPRTGRCPTVPSWTGSVRWPTTGAWRSTTWLTISRSFASPSTTVRRAPASWISSDPSSWACYGSRARSRNGCRPLEPLRRRCRMRPRGEQSPRVATTSTSIPGAAAAAATLSPRRRRRRRRRSAWLAPGEHQICPHPQRAVAAVAAAQPRRGQRKRAVGATRLGQAGATRPPRTRRPRRSRTRGRIKPDSTFLRMMRRKRKRRLRLQRPRLQRQRPRRLRMRLQRRKNEELRPRPLARSRSARGATSREASVLGGIHWTPP
mmetsp:Transcript_69938/g.149724  ORF Transcript_69938/g.149724 Transcript_69938/m.149724 type:complete len:262 (+) Transcript_69938:668-1453(+)